MPGDDVNDDDDVNENYSGCTTVVTAVLRTVKITNGYDDDHC